MTDTAPEQAPRGPEARDADRPESPDESTTHESGVAGEEDRPREIGGRKGPDPTRYGDWEKNGRCIDF